MLDPRIYRTALVGVAVAVIVVAFSLHDQQGPLTTSLAPDAFNGQNVYSLANRLAAEYPVRAPGSTGDDALADQLGQTFSHYGFAVGTSTFSARTAIGDRTLQTVTATRAGLGGGSILVVAHRDAMGSPAAESLSGTATLLELARVLAGETHQRTIVLASTSGSAGAAGAAKLASQVGSGLDAVIALGDLGSPRLRQPVVATWSDGQELTPPQLRNTIAAALTAQGGPSGSKTSLSGQLVHLALPLTPGEQGPFGAKGLPAVLLSSSDEREQSSNTPLDAARATVFGRSLLQTVNALDGGPTVPRDSAYLLFQGKVVPAWAIRLLALALLLPVLAVAVDGFARARRRGHRMARWTLWTLAAAAPFALVFGLVLAVTATGLLGDAPPELVGPGAVPLHAGGVALLVALACLLAGSALAMRALRRRFARLEDEDGAEQGQDEGRVSAAGAATLLVMCCAALAVWVANPFAALLVLPALHLWIWVLDQQVGLHPSRKAALLLVGLAAPVAVVLYYAVALGFGPVDVLWNGLLLIGGGHVAVATLLEWSVLLGCTVSAAAIAMRSARQRQRQEVPVTIRGPVTYAGPGSLGGTESALRR